MFGIPFKTPFGAPFGVSYIGGIADNNNEIPAKIPFHLGYTGEIVFPPNFDFFWQAYESADVTLADTDKISLMQSLLPATTSITQGTAINRPTYIQDANKFNNVARFGEGAPSVSTYPVLSSTFVGVASDYAYTHTAIIKGATALTLCAYVYVPSITGDKRTIFSETAQSGTFRFSLVVDSSGIIRHDLKYNALTTTLYTTGKVQVGWNKIVLTQKFSPIPSEGRLNIYINDLDTPNFSSTHGGGYVSYDDTDYGTPSSIGSWNHNVNGSALWGMTGSISFVRGSTTEVLSNAEIKTLMSTPVGCTDSLDPALKAKMNFAYDASTYTDSQGAWVDHIGSNDMMESGSISYVDENLEIECAGASVGTFMEGLPTITGDRTYILDLKLSTLGTTKYLLQETGGNSAVLALADNYLYLRDTTGSNDIALTSHTLTTDKSVYALVINGTNLLYYVDAVLKETVDITGRTFDWTQVGASVDSSNGDYSQIGRYPSALDQEGINYFSYLNETRIT